MQASNGMLDANQLQQLWRFLEENPEVLANCPPEALRLMVDEHITMPGKQRLKKAVTEVNCDLYYQLALERRLASAHRKALEEFLAACPSVRRQLEWYQYTKLKPDESVTFSAKHLLYRSRTKTIPLWIRTAAAAGVIWLAWLLHHQQQPIEALAPQAAVVSDESTDRSRPTVRASQEEIVTLEVLPAQEPQPLLSDRGLPLERQQPYFVAEQTVHQAVSEEYFKYEEKINNEILPLQVRPISLTVEQTYLEAVAQRKEEGLHAKGLRVYAGRSWIQPVKNLTAVLLTLSGRKEMAGEIRSSNSDVSSPAVRIMLALGPIEVHHTFRLEPPTTVEFSKQH